MRSLFNAEASDFRLEAELPLDAEPWQIGLIVGPSDSGKSSLGSRIWGSETVRGSEVWPTDAPIVDAIAPDFKGGDWQQVDGGHFPPSALATFRHGSVRTTSFRPEKSSGRLLPVSSAKPRSTS